MIVGCAKKVGEEVHTYRYTRQGCLHYESDVEGCGCDCHKLVG